VTCHFGVWSLVADCSRAEVLQSQSSVAEVGARSTRAVFWEGISDEADGNSKRG